MKRHLRTATVATTLLEAARMMKDDRIGFLPICDREGHPLGVVTDRDIVLRACAAGLPLDATCLGEIMSKDPVRCREDAAFETAESLMLSRKTRRILVVDGDDKLVGLITLADIAQRLDPYRAVHWLRELTAMRFRYEK